MTKDYKRVKAQQRRSSEGRWWSKRRKANGVENRGERAVVVVEWRKEKTADQIRSLKSAFLLIDRKSLLFEPLADLAAMALVIKHDEFAQSRDFLRHFLAALILGCNRHCVLRTN